jgi:glycerol-3-phosphate O-acyltransferase / dihydroxyacetone phosphate acyltransferase
MSSIIRVFLSLWFALPGLLMLAPLATIVAFYAEKERKKALAGSDVKIKGTDVMASVKVVSMLILYPIYCFLFSTAFYKICRRVLELPRSTSFELQVLFIVLFPIYQISKLVILTFLSLYQIIRRSDKTFESSAVKNHCFLLHR